MTETATTLTCPNCKASGATAPTATAWRCPKCAVLWRFPSCRICSQVNWVRDTRIDGWVCPHCKSENRSTASVRQDYQRATDRNMRLLYVGLAVMVVGVLLTFLAH